MSDAERMKRAIAAARTLLRSEAGDPTMRAQAVDDILRCAYDHDAPNGARDETQPPPRWVWIAGREGTWVQHIEHGTCRRLHEAWGIHDEDANPGVRAALDELLAIQPDRNGFIHANVAIAIGCLREALARTAPQADQKENEACTTSAIGVDNGSNASSGADLTKARCAHGACFDASKSDSDARATDEIAALREQLAKARSGLVHRERDQARRERDETREQLAAAQARYKSAEWKCVELAERARAPAPDVARALGILDEAVRDKLRGEGLILAVRETIAALTAPASPPVLPDGWTATRENSWWEYTRENEDYGYDEVYVFDDGTIDLDARKRISVDTLLALLAAARSRTA